MYSLTRGQDNENEAKLGIFIINMAADQVKKRDEFCCVPNCNGNARIHKDWSFHHIPSVKKTELRKAWIIAIRRDERPLFKVCDVCTLVYLFKLHLAYLNNFLLWTRLLKHNQYVEIKQFFKVGINQNDVSTVIWLCSRSAPLEGSPLFTVLFI